MEEQCAHLNHSGEVSEVEDVVWSGGGGEEVGDSTIVYLQGTGQNDLQYKRQKKPSTDSKLANMVFNFEKSIY